ncbi:MAG TPA: cupin domain-containing protein [Gemmatimonadaceae bacterium]|nr:cupin domain-containing protein [Gemmatimonadaceae bacterium]
MKISGLSIVLFGVVRFATVSPASAQQPPAVSPVTRTDLLRQTLPAGDFREVQAAVIELQPSASAPRHRHDVAIVAYVVEGTVENQFNGGAVQIHKAGESWWEAPGTVHDIARNASATARARLLIVYIGEPGKPATVPIK